MKKFLFYGFCYPSKENSQYATTSQQNNFDSMLTASVSYQKAYSKFVAVLAQI